MQDYPDYYRLITHPIALSVVRQRTRSTYNLNKTVLSLRHDLRLMLMSFATEV